MSERRRGLGRGLGALIPAGADTADRPSDVFFPRAQPASVEGFTGNDEPRSAEAAGQPESGGVHEGGPSLRSVPGATFAEIPVGSVVPNPRQPRQVFDEDELSELVHSISQVGVLQPVVVRAASGNEGERTYELIMGERRWRACKQAGRETVPAIVRDTGDADLLRDALLENLHRSQLNALEEAAAYQQLLDDFGCTHDELARRIGRSRPQISNTLRLLKLPPLVQRRVASGVLTAGHARALLGRSDRAAMERLAQRIVSEGLSVRTVEEIVVLEERDSSAPRHTPSGRKSTQPDPAWAQISVHLSEQLDTRVTVTMGRRKGRLTVDYGDREDLDRILALLSDQPGSLPA
ncbi:MAG: ParB/RepB/Spo0J family partition protein [Actinobacteria bacterium]|nr:ParB/RepB/Spo0J family partition protein [Actinomycetota bacterium]